MKLIILIAIFAPVLVALLMLRKRDRATSGVDYCSLIDDAPPQDLTLRQDTGKGESDAGPAPGHAAPEAPRD